LTVAGQGGDGAGSSYIDRASGSMTAVFSVDVQPYSIYPTSSGVFLILETKYAFKYEGVSIQQPSPYGSFLVIKYDNDGTFQTLTTLSADTPQSIFLAIVTASGGLIFPYVAGSTIAKINSESITGNDAVVMKFNTNGTIDWKVRCDLARYMTVTSIVTDSIESVFYHTLNYKDSQTIPGNLFANSVFIRLSNTGEVLRTSKPIIGPDVYAAKLVMLDRNEAVFYGRVSLTASKIATFASVP
jgi:hypothetical protein